MTLRIAMWSGPRNISTAMMRSFGARADTAVVDEPFYAAFLAATGAKHPMREAVLRAHEADPATVATSLAGDAPGGAPVFYQKHMTHHLLAGFSREWMGACLHAFLIRDPDRVVASYAAMRADTKVDDIGFLQQGAIFDEVRDRTGTTPPVIDADDVLADPRGVLAGLCAALGLGFDEAMLSWPAGRRVTDGAWAPAWYEAVERSTGFAAPPGSPPDLSASLRAIADGARPVYERLRRVRLLPRT